MGITKHRQRILKVLQEWFSTHEQGPTLEELCQLLEMNPRQKATVQRWLQTMRGIDVEWDAHAHRSLRLLLPAPEEMDTHLPVAETLRYLTTGLVEWEKQSPELRSRIPEALRLGLSQLYLSALLKKENAPSDLLELFKKAEETPLIEWLPNAEEIKHFPPDVTLIEDGLISEFAEGWQVDGKAVTEQVQESVMQDVLEHCRSLQLEDAYRRLRQRLITQPTLRYEEYRQLLTISIFQPLRSYIRQIHMELKKLAEYDVYYLCPRCRYPQRQYSDGTYHCRSVQCQRLCARATPTFPPILPIPKSEAHTWMVVTPGIHKYITLPGLWEVSLHESLTRMGVRVTLYPQIDEYDLRVELPRNVCWMIDVKDWAYLRLDRLKQMHSCLDADETFIVFPDARKDHLRLEVVRDEYEAELGGVRLCYMNEMIDRVKAIVGSKDRA